MQKYIVSAEGAMLSDDFEEGARLKSKDRVVALAKLIYNSINEPPVTLTDDEIFAICEAVPSTDNPSLDWNARVDAMEKGVTIKGGTSTVSATGNVVKLAGINFGKALPAEIDGAFELAIKTADDTDELPMMLAFIIDKVLPRNSNGKITAPIPGTPEKETIKNGDGTETVITYDNPDRFTVKIGGTREVSSYYLEAAKQRPAGQRILKVLAQIDAVGTANPDCEASITHPDGRTTTFEGFKAMTVKSRKGVRMTWKARLDGLANKMRRAANICLKCEAINAMNRIEVSLVSEKKAGAPELKLAGLSINDAGYAPIYGSKKPFILGDTKVKNSATDPMSVTSFLALDPASVGEDATLDALIETGAREEPKAPGTVGAVAAIAGGDVTKWQDYLAETTAWITTVENMNVLRVLAANGKLPEGVIASMHDLEDILATINAYTQKAFDLIEDKRQKEREAEKAERDAKLQKTG